MDHSLRGVFGAEISLLAALHSVRWLFGTPLAPAPPRVDAHHPGLGVSGAELSFFAAFPPVRRERLTPSMGARLVALVDHPRQSMLGAVLSLFAPLQAVGRALGALLVRAYSPVDAHHAVRGVLGAKLPLLAALQAVRRPFRASTVCALFTDDADHPQSGVFRAELSLFATFHTERRLPKTTLLRASLAAGHVYHTLQGMLGAKLRLAPFDSVGRSRGAPLVCTAVGVRPTGIGLERDIFDGGPRGGLESSREWHSFRPQGVVGKKGVGKVLSRRERGSFSTLLWSRSRLPGRLPPSVFGSELFSTVIKGQPTTDFFLFWKRYVSRAIHLNREL